MCVIAVYPKSVKLNKEELKTCFASNPDGAGFMFNDGILVTIKKGFMDFASFWEEAEKLPENVDRVFHFRIATSGKISAACCHPFPITGDLKDMMLAETTCKMGFAHNGVLREFTPAGGMKATYSDSMKFGKDVLYPLGTALNLLPVRNLIELYTISRFAIMTPCYVHMIGNFEQSRESGAFYSNDSYKPYQASFFYDCGDYYDEDLDYSHYIEAKVPDSIEGDSFDELLEDIEEAADVLIYDFTVYNGYAYLYYEGIPTKKRGTVTVDGVKINWRTGVIK